MFHCDEKSVGVIENSLKSSIPGLNLTIPSKIECKELDIFLQNQIGCQTDNVNIFSALANSKSDKICTLVEKKLVDDQSVAFNTFTAGEKRAIRGPGILHLALKTNQSPNSFQVFTADI